MMMACANQISLQSLPRKHVIIWHGQKGLSLIELMISITIGLMLMAGVAALIASQSSTREELNKSSRQIENGRYAIQLLKDDIQLAGYYGEFSDVAPPTAMPDPCAITAAALQASMTVPIQGYAAPASVPSPLSACLSDADHLDNTDILVIRRVDTATPIAVAAGAANQIYLQAGFATGSTANFGRVVGAGPDAAAFILKTKAGVVASLRKFLVHIYYLSPCHIPAAGNTSCTAAADNGDPIPTLKRMELSVEAGVSKFIVAPLAEGIEKVHFDYGVDYTGPDSIVDGAPDCYVNNPGSALAAETALCPATAATYFASAATTQQKWANVTAVRISLLARNTEKSPGHSDTKKYNLGGAGEIAATGDQYRRHVFSGLVRAVNVSGRREK